MFSPVNATAQAERFTWKSANYGGSVEVVYTVEVEKRKCFKTPKSIDQEN
jgi:hypothetical protein